MVAYDESGMRLGEGCGQKRGTTSISEIFQYVAPLLPQACYCRENSFDEAATLCAVCPAALAPPMASDSCHRKDKKPVNTSVNAWPSYFQCPNLLCFDLASKRSSLSHGEQRVLAHNKIFREIS